jgi:coenzyme F420-reducing hydrogenase delta subunit
MVAGCQPGECFFNTGNLHVTQRVKRIADWLDGCGLERDRVHMMNLTPGDHDSLENALKGLSEKTGVCGPSPLRRTGVTPAPASTSG